jgi:anti-sigma B factor antagonist
LAFVPVDHLSQSRLSVQSAELEDVFVVSVRGELDLYGADALRLELDSVWQQGASRIVVDLSEVTFVDSTALGVLVLAAKRMRSRKGTLTLVLDDPRTLRVFEVTGLNRVFPLERSLGAAIDAAVGAQPQGSP